MKCHTGVDAGSGSVHTVEATAANVHDIIVAAKLPREDAEVVYGDIAYLGLEKRDEIKHDPQLTGSSILRTSDPLTLQSGTPLLDCEGHLRFPKYRLSLTAKKP